MAQPTFYIQELLRQANAADARAYLGISGGGAVKFSAGTLSSNRSDITFSNANGVSFGLDNAGLITASVAPGATASNKFSAGTLSALRTDLTFNNSNGVTFGLDAGGNITASVQTNYQSPGAYLTTAQPPGAYLTTAALSQDSSKYAGTGFTTATTAGTNIVGTLNNGGLSLGIPAYLTTAATGGGGITAIKVSAGTLSSNRSDVTFADSNGVTFGLDTNGVITASINQVTGAISNVKFSAGTLSSNRTDITFSNSNGVSFGLDTNGVLTATVATNYQSAGGYLTTAALSQDSSKYAGTNGSMVGGSFTLNTSGATISLPPYLTTAMLSNASSVFAGTGFTSVTTAGTNIVATLNTSGLSMGIPAYLTTETAGAPHLDEVLNPLNDALFGMNTRQVQFQWGTNLSSFITAASRQGLFEIDVKGGTGFATATGDRVDALHVHQSVGDPYMHMLHCEADGTNAIGIHVTVAGSVGMEINAPISYNGGSVPMILGTSQSNSVANLNANFVQGKASSVLAGTGFTTATTAGTNIVGTLQTNGLSMGIPAYLTTAGAGGGVAISNSQTLFSNGTVAFSAATGGAMTIASSAGGQSLIFSVPQTSSIVGSGMMSISTTGNTIYISAPNTSSMVGQGLTISTNGSTFTIQAPATSSIVGANNINISTNGSTISVIGSLAGSNISVNTIAGTDLTLGADTNGITIGYPKWLTNATAGANIALSFWANMYPANTNMAMGGMTNTGLMYVAPFVLPLTASAQFLRIVQNRSIISTANVSGTTANTSFTANMSHSMAIQFFTQMNGISSSSLGLYTSTLVTECWQTAITAGNTGSQYTVSINGTYPVMGTYSNTTATYAASTTSYNISTQSLSLFTGARYYDIPFSASLSPGNYWIAIGIGSATARNAGPAAITNAHMNLSTIYGGSGGSSTLALLGAAANNSVGMFPGLGSISTNSAIFSTSNFDMSIISSGASNPTLFFQFQRSA